MPQPVIDFATYAEHKAALKIATPTRNDLEVFTTSAVPCHGVVHLGISLLFSAGPRDYSYLRVSCGTMDGHVARGSVAIRFKAKEIHLCRTAERV